MDIKKNFKFKELLTLWECDKANIHLLIKNGYLVPCLRWNNFAILCRYEESQEGSNQFLLRQVTDSKGDKAILLLNKTLYLRNPQSIGSNEYIFTEGTREAVFKDQYNNSRDWYQFLDNKNEFDVVLINSSFIETDCFFTFESIQTCEKLHSDLILKSNISELAQSANIKKKITSKNNYPNEDLLSVKERNNLHRIISALVQTVIKVSNRDSNLAFQSQAELIQYLESLYDGYSGLKKSNLENVIASGNSLFNSPK